MELEAAFSLRTAPRFHPRTAWPDRLRLNSGVERVGARWHPRPDWRPLTREELGLLVGRAARCAGSPGSASPAAADGSSGRRPQGSEERILGPSEAALLAIPARLRAAWWDQAERMTTAVSGDRDAFDRFAAALLEFLRFKRLPLPALCRVEVTVSKPGQPGTRIDPVTGGLAGLALPAASSATPGGRTVAAINLGDEATHLVLLNLPHDTMRALRARHGQPCAAALPPAELAARFFDALPTYPLTRLRLEAGEGLWLPAADVICDGWTNEKVDIDVVLTIRGEPSEALRETARLTET